MHESEPPHITVIGGGTGSSTLLSELKHYTPNLSAVVNMSDDGGSSGRLRDELGVMPPGDVRQCLTALSNEPVLADIYASRFEEGVFEGHAFGNLVLAYKELESDFATAVKYASKLLDITGQVIPVTLRTHDLVMQDGGEVIRGEHTIGHRPIQHRSPKVWLEPAVGLTNEAEEAIHRADQIVIAPGNAYGSILPALLVDGMRQVLADARGQKVVVSNLINKPGQTDNWHALDYVEMYEEQIGRVDFVLYNNHVIDPSILADCSEGQQQVGFEPSRFDQRPEVQVVGGSFVNETIHAQGLGDKNTQRTTLRHNAVKISQHLIQMAGKENP